MVEEEEGEPEMILEPYEITYSDLLLLSTPSSSSYDAEEEEEEEEEEKKNTKKRSIMEALGPNGPGLISINATDLPHASSLSHKLLPSARSLALIHPQLRNRILKDHRLGTDVPMKDPERNVSSFAMQLRYARGKECSKDSGSNIRIDSNTFSKHLEDGDNDFENLGNTFKELGFLMMDMGLLVARICDSCIGGHELEKSLLELGTAKGRLIHYHSTVENQVMLKEAQAGRRKMGSKAKLKTAPQIHADIEEAESPGTTSSLWQQWHYDYGVFTILTSPMFLSSSFPGEDQNLDSIWSFQECPYPEGHTYLQILDLRKHNLFMVKTSPGNFIVQVGESADILSKGKLRSTLHCVRRPLEHENVSRETFVVFLQPAWTKTFSLCDYPMIQLASGAPNSSEEPYDEAYAASKEKRKVIESTSRTVPPLMSRLKDGMTFAEFSKETTKQYYGSGGLQSNR